MAVKVLHAELQRHDAVRARFLREGYVANKVAHPGVVSAIDDGVDEGGAVFIVMELLTGKSLGQRFEEQGGKLQPREVFHIADELLEVLAAAHAQGVVHRDLKPDNVFLTEGTEAHGVKVLDFGVARVLEGGEGKTKTGVVMGTPEYMPPEQARGRSEQIDGRTDLWATAAMMYRLITGHYVHEAETPNEVLLLAMTAHAKKLVEVAPYVHSKVCAVIDRALAYEPDERFPNAEAMRAAVKEALVALDEQDGKATLAVPSPVDPGGKTLAVGDSDILTVSPASPDESSPKQSLWVHTKATHPPPRRLRRRGVRRSQSWPHRARSRSCASGSRGACLGCTRYGPSRLLPRRPRSPRTTMRTRTPMAAMTKRTTRSTPRRASRPSSSRSRRPPARTRNRHTSQAKAEAIGDVAVASARSSCSV